MDDDELRRGRPTCHVKFGEDVAILAGDGLYAEAFRLVLREQQGDPASILAAVCELAAATGVNGMVGGQYIDVKALVPAGEATLRRLHELKTGRLIGASVECVLLLIERDDRASTLPSLPRFRGGAGRPLPDRRRHPRRDRNRRRPGEAARQRRAPREA